MSSPIKQQLELSPKLKKALEVARAEIGRDVKNEEEAKRVLSDLLNLEGTRPMRWNRNTNAPYFKERYGLWIKGVLTDIKNRKTNVLLRPKDFSKSRASLILMVNQAWMWLIEHEPKEGWKELRYQIEVQKSTDGVWLCWKFNPNEEIKIEASDMSEEAAEWKSELLTFIEFAKDNQRLVLDNLKLTEDNIKWIEKLVRNAPGIFIKRLSSVRVELLMNKVVWERLSGS